MSSNYMQEAGLGIKNYSFLCQAVSTFADVLIMALQSYIQTNPSPKERQCIKELIKDAKMHEGTVNKDKNEDGRKPTVYLKKRVRLLPLFHLMLRPWTSIKLWIMQIFRRFQ